MKLYAVLSTHCEAGVSHIDGVFSSMDKAQTYIQFAKGQPECYEYFFDITEQTLDAPNYEYPRVTYEPEADRVSCPNDLILF